MRASSFALTLVWARLSLKLVGGWLTLGKLRGAPVRLHWSLPVGAIFVSRFAWAPAVWLAFAFIVLIHEIGHAVMVRWAKQEVIEIRLHGLGGECEWEGEPTAIRRALIAWGGVLGQLVLLCGALIYFALMPPMSSFAATTREAFVWTNLWIMGINLLPIAPLDGKEAWRLPGLLRARLRLWRARRAKRRVKAPQIPPPRIIPGNGVPGEVDQPLSSSALAAIERAREIARREASTKSRQ